MLRKDSPSSSKIKINIQLKNIYYLWKKYLIINYIKSIINYLFLKFNYKLNVWYFIILN